MVQHVLSVICLFFKLAHPIRLLLAYTGTDYEDTRYESPGGKCSKFANVKDHSAKVYY